MFVYLLNQISTIIKKLENENRAKNEITDFIEKIELIWKYKIEDAKLNPAEIEIKKRISTKIEYYINKINTIDLENNILLKKGATINDLAIDLKIPKSHMAFIFKYNCKISFVSFKNRIRIENSKKLIKDNYLEANTLNSLAEKIGFKSYDPFFKSFKEITGTGPMEYNITNKRK
jgi:AraC-like DNA-binding protein